MVRYQPDVRLWCLVVWCYIILAVVTPVRCETRVFSSVMLGYCGAIPARCETRVFSSVMLLFSLWCDTIPMRRDNGVVGR